MNPDLKHSTTLCTILTRFDNCGTIPTCELSRYYYISSFFTCAQRRSLASTCLCMDTMCYNFEIQTFFRLVLCHLMQHHNHPDSVDTIRMLSPLNLPLNLPYFLEISPQRDLILRCCSMWRHKGGVGQTIVFET